MSWPLSHEFNEAIQNPHVAFADPDLRTGETVVGATGLPLPRSGNFADVYQVRGADGREWAVKCFTRPVAGLAERYAKVSEALTKANLPFVVGFTFLAEGIRVAGVWRPVIKMEWVEGLLLNQVVRDNAAKPAILGALGLMWVRLCKRLREAGIAHADLQHGNVLLVPGSRPGAYGLKLIDYDGMWVPALANTPSGESGHPAYQHPARVARSYSPDVDRFPYLAVATALKGLAVAGTALWEKYDTGDNLLFTEADYKKPAESKLMKELWHTGDPSVQALVGRLAIACGKPIPQTPWLDQLAPEGEVPPLDDATRREAAAALGISLPAPAPVPLPLPPEPAVLPLPLPPKPASQELPTEPAFDRVPPKPAPLPVEPTDWGAISAPDPAPKPASAPASAKKRKEEDEEDEEADEREERRESKPRKRERDEPSYARRTAQSGGPNKRVLIFAGVGLLLLVGGVVAAIAFSGGKPKETVENKEPKDPGPKPPTPGPGPGPGPKPKDKVPKDPIPPAPPVEPGPAPTVDRLEVRSRWVIDLPNGFDAMRAPVCDAEGRSVLLLGKPRGAPAVFDAATGNAIPTGYTDDPRALYFGAAALDGRQFALLSPEGPASVPVLDVPNGKTAFLPTHRGTEKGPAQQFVSPDRQIAVTGGYAAGDEPQPLRVKRTADGALVKDLTWTRGTVVFTADSARMLVAEYSGKGRWFKLPSGEADGEWAIPPAKGPRANLLLLAASADGTVLLYQGAIEGREGLRHAIDGRDGKVIRSFATPFAAPLASMSADGSLVLLPKPAGGWSRSADLVQISSGAVVAELTAPEGWRHMIATLLPDGRGAVAFGGSPAKLARYDFVRPGSSPDPGPPPVKPPDPPVKPPDPVSPPNPGSDLKVRWTAENKKGPAFLDADGQTLAVVGRGAPWSVATFDARTGKEGRELKGLPGNFYRLFPLEKGKFGLQDTALRQQFTIWDSVENKAPAYAPKMPDTMGRSPTLNVSPNGKYVVIAAPQYSPGTQKEFPTSQVRVLDLTTFKDVVSTDWHVGASAFTADSSRVLLFDATGAARLFKLADAKPDAKPEREWKLGLQPTVFNVLQVALSGDGDVVLWHGILRGKENAHHLLDGKTGAVRYSFPANRYHPVYGSVSDDGRHVALVRGHAVEVLDARGKLVVSVEIAKEPKNRLTGMCVNWKTHTLVVQEQAGDKLTVYDLPDLREGAPKPPAPKAP